MKMTFNKQNINKNKLKKVGWTFRSTNLKVNSISNIKNKFKNHARKDLESGRLYLELYIWLYKTTKWTNKTTI